MNFDYKGKILVSTPNNSVDIFSRSVVLIIDHNIDGAWGFILNRKSVSIRDGLLGIGIRMDVYVGGPVLHKNLCFITRGNTFMECGQQISDEFFISDDIHCIASAILDNSLEVEDVKILSGYCGWAKGQLEAEVRRGQWIVAPSEPIDYVAPSDQNLWKSIMKNIGGSCLVWANAPQDILMN